MAETEQEEAAHSDQKQISATESARLVKYNERRHFQPKGLQKHIITPTLSMIWTLFSQTQPSDIVKIWRNGTSHQE